MNKQTEEFIDKMQEFFPGTREMVNESIEKYGTVLETVVIEDIFMPPILKLLSENKETKRLKEIFSYFEEIVNNNDLHLMNIFSITVMEILGNDKSILEKAEQYMGTKTRMLQRKADENLGRKEERKFGSMDCVKNFISELKDFCGENSRWYNELVWFCQTNYTTTSEYYGDLMLLVERLCNDAELKEYHKDLNILLQKLHQLFK